jgi:hypothetical protein
LQFLAFLRLFGDDFAVGDAAAPFGDPHPRRHLDLVGALDPVLVVLPLRDEATDADHRHRGEQREADREPDSQPVGQRGTQPAR